MSDIITIEKGNYELNSSISVSIDTSLEFNFGENYLLVGDNGVGKSSFVSKLLLPLIIPMSENNFKIFYIPQDVTIQYYLVKYYWGMHLTEVVSAQSLVIQRIMTFNPKIQTLHVIHWTTSSYEQLTSVKCIPLKYYYNGLLNEQHDFATIGDALTLVASNVASAL